MKRKFEIFTAMKEIHGQPSENAGDLLKPQRLETIFHGIQFLAKDKNRTVPLDLKFCFKIIQTSQIN